MRKLILILSLMIFMTGCTKQIKTADITPSVTPTIMSEIDDVENDNEVIGTYLLYYDGEKGSSGIIIVLGPSAELTMLIPQMGNVLQSYRGTYTAVDGILSFNMREVPPDPSGRFGHSVFEYVVDGENILLTHTDYSNARHEKTFYSLEYVDTLDMIRVK